MRSSLNLNSLKWTWLQVWQDFQSHNVLIFFIQNKSIQLSHNHGLETISMKWKSDPNNSREMTVDQFISVALRKKELLLKVMYGKLLKSKETMNPFTYLKWSLIHTQRLNMDLNMFHPRQQSTLNSIHHNIHRSIHLNTHLSILLNIKDLLSIPYRIHSNRWVFKEITKTIPKSIMKKMTGIKIRTLEKKRKRKKRKTKRRRKKRKRKVEEAMIDSHNFIIKSIFLYYFHFFPLIFSIHFNLIDFSHKIK